MCDDDIVIIVVVVGNAEELRRGLQDNNRGEFGSGEEFAAASLRGQRLLVEPPVDHRGGLQVQDPRNQGQEGQDADLGHSTSVCYLG